VNVFGKVRVSLGLGCVIVKTSVEDGIIIEGALDEVDRLGRACDMRLDGFEVAFDGS
jgi:hypothetical protein